MSKQVVITLVLFFASVLFFRPPVAGVTMIVTEAHAEGPLCCTFASSVILIKTVLIVDAPPDWDGLVVNWRTGDSLFSCTVPALTKQQSCPSCPRRIPLQGGTLSSSEMTVINGVSCPIQARTRSWAFLFPLGPMDATSACHAPCGLACF